MAKREVVITTCDRCGKEEQSDPPKPGTKGHLDEFFLPEGWLHIRGNDRRKLLFEMQLCPGCTEPVLAAAGMGPTA